MTSESRLLWLFKKLVRVRVGVRERVLELTAAFYLSELRPTGIAGARVVVGLFHEAPRRV
jgi:hypothetical protein